MNTGSALIIGYDWFLEHNQFSIIDQIGLDVFFQETLLVAAFGKTQRKLCSACHFQPFQEGPAVSSDLENCLRRAWTFCTPLFQADCGLPRGTTDTRAWAWIKRCQGGGPGVCF